MKYSNYFLFFWGSLLFFLGCDRATPTNNHTEEVIVVTNENSKKLSEIIESYRYIPLGDTKKLIGKIDQILVNDDYIIVVDKQQSKTVYVFNHQGECLFEINALGRSATEYSIIDHVAIIPNGNNDIAILDRINKKILVYNISGVFLNSYTIPIHIEGMEYIDNKNIICYTDAYIRKDVFFQNRDDANNLIFFTDGEYNIISSTLPNNTSREISFTQPIVKNTIESIMVNPALSTEIYAVKGRELYPMYKIDLSNLGVSINFDNKSEQEIVNAIDKNLMFTGNFCLTSQYLLFSVSIPTEGGNHIYIYDKQKNVCQHISIDAAKGDAMLAGMSVSTTKAAYKDEFVGDISAYIVPMVYPQGADIPILRNVNENSNPILVFYKLK